ncbi:MAG TPA: aldo/keto reductase, partial [Streptosporangiaceae bacterium]
VQNPYSLLDRSLEEEMFPFARALGIGMMAYAPLATGLLSGVYAPGVAAPPGTFWGDRRRDQLDRVLGGQAGTLLAVVREVAERAGATVAQVALAWVLKHEEVTTAITGADSDARLDENLGALELRLGPDDLEQLDRASAGLALRLDGPEFPSNYAAGAAPNR